uniref:Carbonyl reductase 1 n=1 Tax=Neolamprologus brichardi TaxID=32507 RepID=A0A3Q4GLN3_NEOBR
MSTRVAVVTGSNKGIGLATVRALCKEFEGDVYLTARNCGIYQGDALSPLLFSIRLNPLSEIIDKTDYGYRLRTGAVVSHLLYINDIKLYAKSERDIDSLIHTTRIYSNGRVVNVSSMNCVSGLKKCSPDLQQRFRNENITEEELVELMQRFVDEAKKGEHKERGWTDGAYTVSKIGLTVLSVIHARRLTKERPNDGILLNACCPGWVRTDMAGPTAPKSPDEGAVTPVYLALLPSGAKEPHGKYLSDKEVQPW